MPAEADSELDSALMNQTSLRLVEVVMVVHY